MIYIRKCKTCGGNILHKNEKLLLLGIKNDGECKRCSASKDIPVGIWEENGNWCRKCPTCKQVIRYNGEYGKVNVKYSHKQLYDCKKCSALKRSPKSEETKKKISISLTGRIIPRETVEKISNILKQKFNTPEYKRRFSELNLGENNGMYGKHHSEETKASLSQIIKMAMNSDSVKTKMNKIRKSITHRELMSRVMTGRKFSIEHCRKLRLAHIGRIEKMIGNGLPLNPKFNPKACEIINEYAKNNGYNFQHAMNGGEFYIKHLGYWVDGYDKEKNIVLEVDEPHHFDIYGNLKRRDVERQKEIEKFLHCRFIRIPLRERT